jgi:hypothetical protein
MTVAEVAAGMGGQREREREEGRRANIKSAAEKPPPVADVRESSYSVLFRLIPTSS